jgi:undecaprenyl-diphosphatase
LSILEAVILGLVQGISEFLPISSTGHLTLAGKLMNLIDPQNPEKWTAFIAVIQLGTLVSILVYFWKDIISIIKAFFKDNLTSRKSFKQQSYESRLGWLVIIGTVPVVVVGLGFKKVIEGALTKNLWVIAGSLVGVAIIIAIAEYLAKHKKDVNEVTVKDALIVGIAQCFALIPGSSRSGTTLAGGLFAGLKRDAAARFSFLLSIPAVAASGLLEFKESVKFLDKSLAVNMALATIVSGVVGYFCIDFLLKFLRKNTTLSFVIYRVLLGGFILFLLYKNIITP